MTVETNKVTISANATRPMSAPTVAASYVRRLLELAISKGAPRQQLFARAKLSERDLDDVDNRIPLTKFLTLMRAGQELSGDPALALHFGEAPDGTEMSIVNLVGQGCATFGEAFIQQNRFARLAVEVDTRDGRDRLSLLRDAAGLWLVDNRANPNEFPEITESSFARMACAARQMAAPGLVRAVHFTHDEPGYRDEYDRILQVPIFFNSDKNALLLANDDWLTQKLALQPPYVFEVLGERAEKLLRELDDTKSVRGRVEGLLALGLSAGRFGMVDIAGQLGVSTRTLSRRLRAEGATFEEVLDELRHKLATYYLGERHVSVTEAGRLLGYSEHTAFSRAFKRWTGSLPRAAKTPR